MTIQHVFHGSLSADRQVFAPLTHFSFSRETALHALAGRFFVGRELGTPTLYECAIDVQDCELVLLDAFSQTHSTGRTKRWQARDEYSLERHIKAERYVQGRRGKEASASVELSWLREMSGRENVVGYTYVNEVEGGVCVCLLDTSKVQVVSAEAVSMRTLAHIFLRESNTHWGVEPNSYPHVYQVARSYL